MEDMFAILVRIRDRPLVLLADSLAEGKPEAGGTGVGRVFVETLEDVAAVQSLRSGIADTEIFVAPYDAQGAGLGRVDIGIPAQVGYQELAEGRVGGCFQFAFAFQTAADVLAGEDFVQVMGRFLEQFHEIDFFQTGIGSVFDAAELEHVLLQPGEVAERALELEDFLHLAFSQVGALQELFSQVQADGHRGLHLVGRVVHEFLLLHVQLRRTLELERNGLVQFLEFRDSCRVVQGFRLFLHIETIDPLQQVV